MRQFVLVQGTDDNETLPAVAAAINAMGQHVANVEVVGATNNRKPKLREGSATRASSGKRIASFFDTILKQPPEAP